jgi:predicted ATPase
VRVARRGPVAILIEDIHWADETVLGHLAVIADAVRDCAALLVMTSRIEGDPIDAAWRALAQGSPLMTIDLGALREAEALALADAYLDGDNNIARICVERAEGNPLFLDQLLRNAGEDAAAALPGSVSSIMLARMDRLDPMDRDALQAASVIGQRFTAGALRNVMGIQGYDDQPLRDHVLLRRAGDDLIFAHALIRECVYASLLGDRRRDLHRRAADWFAGKDGDSGDAGLRAEHLDRAKDPQAPGAYLTAARIQADAYHEDRAIELTTRGIELAQEQPDKYALFCLHAELLQQLARPAESVEAYREALSSAETDRETCNGLIGVAAGIRLTGGDVDGMAALDEAEALTQNAEDDDFERELAQINLQKGNFRFATGEIDLCMAHHQKSLAHAERAGDAELQARALGGLGDAHYAHCRMRESLDYFRRCLVVCEEHNFGRIMVAHRFVTGVTRRYLNETKEAMTDVRDAVELCHRVGNPRAAMYALTIQGELLTEGLNLTEAEPSLQEALVIADNFGNRRFRSYILMKQARLSLVSNQLEQARSLIDEAHDLSVETDPRFLGPRIAGFMAVVARDPAARAAALAEGKSILAQGCIAHNHLWFYRDAMEASLAGENWADALQFATVLEDFTAGEPLPWADFYIARGRALAARGQGADNDAELEGLREQARDIGFLIAIPALDQALETRR